MEADLTLAYMMVMMIDEYRGKSVMGGGGWGLDIRLGNLTRSWGP